MNARSVLAAGALFALATPALAADHAEAPGAAADPAADIADYYAWASDGTIKAALTFSGLMAPGAAATYDADVLYTMHFDIDGDAISDHDIHFRFGMNSTGDWGVQAMNFPGAGAPVQGAVETVIPAPGGMVFAGLRDDPFFFDLTGFTNVVTYGSLFDGKGNLYFDSNRDDLAGTNVMSIVVEFDAVSLLGTDTDFQTWATSSRI
jgi:hypothetical protein